MNINLFRLGLEHLQSSDWNHFEKLSSAFLAAEFEQLRTMASPTGDGGRDSELFCSERIPFIVAQYSISKDWKKKLRHTLRRVSNQFPEVKILLYLSNQEIGGQADTLKREYLEERIALDIRDRNWFIERATTNEIRENAAEELISRIARPYLEGEDIINRRSSPLSSQEARAALLYLGLQWQDDISGKGLTKLSFDALVRAALRDTHSGKRRSRCDIQEAVAIVLPSANTEIVCGYVNSALSRLEKRYVRHWRKRDEFCLTYKEHQRIIARLAEMERENSAFHEEVVRYVNKYVTHIGTKYSPDIDDLVNRIPRVLEKLLLKRGEYFVSAVSSGNLRHIGIDDLIDIVLKDLNVSPAPNGGIQHLSRLVSDVVRELLAEASWSTQIYLRRLANSYTLFSFLKETPDVQSATQKLFSHGVVWLDTTVLLPFIAEQLDDDPIQHKFTRTFEACRRAGIELRVTSGIIQEVAAHMDVALICSRSGSGRWQGRTPFLYHQYLQTGQPAANFDEWLDTLRGDERPEEDLAQFLTEIGGIKREDLIEASERVDSQLSWAAERHWTEVHQKRRQSAQLDDLTMRRLIRHDLETYLGVIGLRLGETVTELGYKHWLLTLDRTAWQIRDRLRKELSGGTAPSPLLSLSFLINNLTFGPSRHSTREADPSSIPLLLDIEMSVSVHDDILEIANDVRKRNEGMPEYVIRRRVRDAIDNARRHGYLR